MVGLFGKRKKDETKGFIKNKKKELKKLVKEKKYNMVIKTGTQILDKNPDEFDVLFILGGVYYMRGDLKKAVLCLDKVLEIASYDSEALILKANCMIKLNHFKDAELCCKKIQEIDPKNKAVSELLQNISNQKNKK